MFRRIDDFLSYWNQHYPDTLKIFGALTDASLARTVDDGHRSLARMAWHIALTIPEMAAAVGLTLDGPRAQDPVPDTAEAIRRGYEAVARSLAEQIEAQWTDATLEIEDELYGETWKRGRTLMAVVAHEIHHRGQMTVVMRQAGLKFPGVYGPAKEEWPAYGMAEPAV